MTKFLCSMIFFSLCTGCTTLSSYYYKIKPALLTLGPENITTYSDPDFDVSKYKTFSIFSDSKDNDSNEIEKKQLSFFLRCLFEMKGYKFVKLNKHPDFISVIKVDNDYHTYYVPPETITVPEYVRGHTTTSYTNDNGTINTNSGSVWGNYSGTSTTSTYSPDYITSKTYTTNGYTAGSYFIYVSISIYDGNSNQRAFYCDGGGASDNSDERVSCQLIAHRILKNFPNCKKVESENENNNGYVGISTMILTLDGNNYIPVVRNLVAKGPADLAGITPYDKIISIDGKSVVNKPLSEVIKMLRGPVGTNVELGVLMNDEEQDVELERVSKSETKKMKY